MAADPKSNASESWRIERAKRAASSNALPSAADGAERVMLCAICSEPLLHGAILNEDSKWVHIECEENAEWNEVDLDD